MPGQTRILVNPAQPRNPTKVPAFLLCTVRRPGLRPVLLGNAGAFGEWNRTGSQVVLLAGTHPRVRPDFVAAALGVLCAPTWSERRGHFMAFVTLG
jgi:hypothetical protein